MFELAIVLWIVLLGSLIFQAGFLPREFSGAGIGFGWTHSSVEQSMRHRCRGYLRLDLLTNDLGGPWGKRLALAADPSRSMRRNPPDCLRADTFRLWHR